MNRMEQKVAAAITANAQTRLYTISTGGGYSCFGFDNARDHAEQIAKRLGRPELALQAGEYGTVAGYERYRAAVAAWGASKASSETYFDPGTPQAVQRVLESARRSGEPLRLFFGDPDTGEDECQEHDVIGRIGRSGGTLKVPLLIDDGQDGGMAILTRWVVRMLRVSDGKELYRHPGYIEPSFRFGEAVNAAVAVYRTDRKAGAAGKGIDGKAAIDGELVAQFRSFSEACAWVGFMSGITVRPPRVIH